MSYFAKIENDKVVIVIVATKEIIKKNYSGEWIETKINPELDDNYAGIGFNFDRNKRKFIPQIPKDFQFDNKNYSFRLNSNNKIERFEK